MITHSSGCSYQMGDFTRKPPGRLSHRGNHAPSAFASPHPAYSDVGSTSHSKVMKDDSAVVYPARSTTLDDVSAPQCT